MRIREDLGLAISAELEHTLSLFFPRQLEAIKSVEENNTRFAHYTSATVAMKIIQDPYVWMRNAKTMNDFSEMNHGRNCIVAAYNSEAGTKLKELLNEIHPGFTAAFEGIFDQWLPDFEQNTFLTSLSRHDPSEDDYGRLSMWRAYGQNNGVALILNNTPFLSETTTLNAFSSPVSYMTQDEYIKALSGIVDNLQSRRADLEAMPYEYLFGCVFAMFKNDMLCTKHPGFAEEQEWRIYYSPISAPSPAIEPSFAVVDGVPQKIYRIPLRHDPDNGLLHADLNTLLDRIIIGPTSQPLTMWNAFVALLTEAGIENASEKVFVSTIPLRT